MRVFAALAGGLIAAAVLSLASGRGPAPQPDQAWKMATKPGVPVTTVLSNGDVVVDTITVHDMAAHQMAMADPVAVHPAIAGSIAAGQCWARMDNGDRQAVITWMTGHHNGDCYRLQTCIIYFLIVQHTTCITRTNPVIGGGPRLATPPGGAFCYSEHQATSSLGVRQRWRNFNTFAITIPPHTI